MVVTDHPVDMGAIIGAFAVAQIDATGDEPRIRDLDIAERLSMAQPPDIRRVIESETEELRGFGEVCARRRKTMTPSAAAGRHGILALPGRARRRLPPPSRLRKSAPPSNP
jgi:hypothetical protein